MKKTFLSALSIAVLFSGSFASDGKKDVDGKTLFQAKGCTACHQADKDSVGPALKKIAAAYKGKEADLIKFLKGQGKAIVDPAKEAVMKPNLNTTKAMKDNELKALAKYILANK
ncbi:MAG: c-type cytochrome [Sulfurihydrogenibium sp.]|jgi:cytochrome c|nr:c-type cytochrome [Sulfurihydrogenibium sp.]